MIATVVAMRELLRQGRSDDRLRLRLRRIAGGLFVRARRDGAQIPDQPEPRKQLQDVESDVDLPPVEPLARRGHAVVVVVVPALTERDERQEKAVAARVLRLETAAAQRVRERVDA